LLAKTLATIDQLSQGRVEIGVATGWQREEYDAAGIDWAQRGQLLTDTLVACRALWGPSPATFRSESFSFENIWCEPKPFQDRLPIWVAGAPKRRNLDRLVTMGDGWIPPAYADLESFNHDAAIVRAAWARSGRAGAVEIQGDLDVVAGANGRPDLSASLVAGVPQLLDAGATTNGQPYLVLEYVEGQRIDEYCRNRRLPARSNYFELAQWNEMPRAHALVLAVAHRSFASRPVTDFVAKLERGGLFVDVKCQADVRALREHGVAVWRL